MNPPCTSKSKKALAMLQDQPLAWFRDAGIDMRDINHIRAKKVPWLDYCQGSFLRKIMSLFLEHPLALHSNFTCSIT